jgi:tetratricopeptide (TPR) repeat protein
MPKHHESRAPSGAHMEEQVILSDSNDEYDPDGIMSSQPSKFEGKNEGGLFSRIFKKKKSRTLSKHDITSTMRSETEVKKKIQLVNENSEMKKTLPRNQVVVKEAAPVQPGDPLLSRLVRSLNCGLSEPVPARPREDFDRSLAQLRDTLADARKIYLDDMSAVSAEVFARLLSSAGDILKAAGKTEEGIECILESIQLCRRHPTLKEELALSLNDLGLLYCDFGDYKEAKKALLESHAILRDIHGDVNPDVAASAGNLGIAYSGCKENSASSDLIGNAIRTMEAIYGKDHEYTLQQRGLLGASLITAGDASEAKKELRALINRMGQMSTYPAGHPFLSYLETEHNTATRIQREMANN